jgi:hypothetical protein
MPTCTNALVTIRLEANMYVRCQRVHAVQNVCVQQVRTVQINEQKDKIIWLGAKYMEEY